MKVTEFNIYCGETKPKEIIENAYSKTINEGIWRKEVTNENGSISSLWYITKSTKEIFEDKIKEITDEHDELIAELIETKTN